MGGLPGCAAEPRSELHSAFQENSQLPKAPPMTPQRARSTNYQGKIGARQADAPGWRAPEFGLSILHQHALGGYLLEVWPGTPLPSYNPASRSAGLLRPGIG